MDNFIERLESGGLPRDEDRPLFDVRDGDGRTPLFIAIETGNISAVERMLALTADANGHSRLLSHLSTDDSMSPLHTAALSGNARMIRVILPFSRPMHYILQDEFDRTPLGTAAFYGVLPGIRVLVPATMYAASSYNQSDRLIQDILDDALNEAMFPNTPFPLYLPQMASVVTMLFRAGANGNHIRSNGRPLVTDIVATYPLGQNRANIISVTQILSMFLQRGVSIDIDSHDQEHRTPLLVVVARGRANNSAHNAACLLLDYGADVDAADLDGNTPLYVATRNGDERTVALLLSRGANPVRQKKRTRRTLFA